jgi:hypothetical protein
MILVNAHKSLAIGGILSSLSMIATLSANVDESLNHHWAFLADYVLMKRSQLHNHTIVNRTPTVICSPCQNFGVLGTKKMMDKFGFESGARVAISYLKDRRNSFEVNGLYIWEWEGNKVMHGNAALSYPFHNSNYTNDFVNARRAEAKYESQFYSAEGNFWRFVTPRRIDYFSVSGLLGLRYIHLREKSTLAFFKGSNKSNYNIRANNILPGVQVGGCFEWNPTNYLTWNFTTKFGGLVNRSSQKTFLGDNNNTRVIRDFKVHKWDATFLADIAASIQYQVTSHINLHGGYQVIYLAGVALSPEQYTNNSSSSLAHHRVSDGNILLHGLFAGFTLSF